MARNTDMLPGGTAIELSGRTFELAFTLDAVDEVCAAFDVPVNGIADILRGSDKDGFRGKIIKMLAVLINSGLNAHNEDYPDDQQEPVTETWLKRRLTPVSFAAAYDALVNAYIRGFINANGTRDEDDISEDPNRSRAT